MSNQAARICAAAQITLSQGRHAPAASILGSTPRRHRPRPCQPRPAAAGCRPQAWARGSARVASWQVAPAPRVLRAVAPALPATRTRLARLPLRESAHHRASGPHIRPSHTILLSFSHCSSLDLSPSSPHALQPLAAPLVFCPRPHTSSSSPLNPPHLFVAVSPLLYPTSSPPFHPHPSPTPHNGCA